MGHGTYVIPDLVELILAAACSRIIIGHEAFRPKNLAKLRILNPPFELELPNRLPAPRKVQALAIDLIEFSRAIQSLQGDEANLQALDNIRSKSGLLLFPSQPFFNWKWN
jgi:hypothetical protein